MPMDEASAAIAADNLMDLLIKHQPNLFELKGTHEAGGVNLAQAITGLRKGLIEMYKTQP